MQTPFQLFPLAKLVIISISCALFLSACGGGGSSTPPAPNPNVSGVATPSKVSIVNTNQ